MLMEKNPSCFRFPNLMLENFVFLFNKYGKRLCTQDIHICSGHQIGYKSRGLTEINYRKHVPKRLAFYQVSIQM